MSKIDAKVCSVCMQLSANESDSCAHCGGHSFLNDAMIRSMPSFVPIYLMRRAGDRHQMKDCDDPVYIMAFAREIGSNRLGEICNLSLANLTTLLGSLLELLSSDETIRRDVVVDMITPELNALCERAKFDRSTCNEESN